MPGILRISNDDRIRASAQYGDACFLTRFTPDPAIAPAEHQPRLNSPARQHQRKSGAAANPIRASTYAALKTSILRAPQTRDDNAYQSRETPSDLLQPLLNAP